MSYPPYAQLTIEAQDVVWFAELEPRRHKYTHGTGEQRSQQPAVANEKPNLACNNRII
jgi:hypothetical protein